MAALGYRFYTEHPTAFWKPLPAVSTITSRISSLHLTALEQLSLSQVERYISLNVAEFVSLSTRKVAQ
jgi:hypothetical protein